PRSGGSSQGPEAAIAPAAALWAPVCPVTALHQRFLLERITDLRGAGQSKACGSHSRPQPPGSGYPALTPTPALRIGRGEEPPSPPPPLPILGEGSYRALQCFEVPLPQGWGRGQG